MENNATADWRAYTRQEAAGILHVPVNQVDAAIHRGELAHFRVGKHVRITDVALRQFAGLEPAAA
jgi:excisionase family DNA binding protein